jgi:hypothetical protein
LVLLVSFAAAGCTRHKSGLPPTGTTPADTLASSNGSPSKSKLIVTPENSLVGTVVSFNQAGRFVVLNFPIGHLPTVGERLQVYRHGLKVGEIKVTGPQFDDLVAGDLVTGEANAGDLVRDQ